MSESRDLRTAFERLEWDEQSRIPTEPHTEEEIKALQEVAEDPFSSPGQIREWGEPGPYIVADFVSPCAHGDVIWSGDTIRADGHGEWEHKECAQEGGPMFMDRPEPADVDDGFGYWSEGDYS